MTEEANYLSGQKYPTSYQGIWTTGYHNKRDQLVISAKSQLATDNKRANWL